MKGNKKISQFVSVSVASMLIMLLVLSPCKVRNSIESAFGAEQTTTSNKSKATLNTSSCLVFEGLPVLEKTTKSSVDTESNPTAVPSPYSAVTTQPAIPSPFRDIKRSESVPPIPYYLLYKNFKAYLA